MTTQGTSTTVDPRNSRPAGRVGRAARQRIAAAIDFGTHGSGYAWAFTSERSRPLAERRLVFHDDWVDQAVPFLKTRTALLTDVAGRVLEWGHPAGRRFKRESRHRDDLRLRQQFKMSLPGPGAQLADNPDAPALVTAFLEKLYGYAVERICAATQVRENEIRWGVTVPAIWRDLERDVMRRAAVAAGMPDDPRRLLILDEPVVASQYCHAHLRLAGDGTGTGAAADPDARRILVVDAGGGTVDITSFDGDAKALTEVGYASGGPHGGMYVDKAFLVELLSERIGAELFEQLRVEQPETVLQILDEWERQKRHFDPTRDTPFNLDLPIRLYQALQRDGRLERFAARQGGVEDLIVLNPTEVAAAFDRAVGPILALVDEHLARIGTDTVDHVFLVGGFAQSPYLQARLRRHLAGRAETLVPPNPASAVLAGAVHHVLAPDVVVARKSLRTYGIATNLPFEDETDSPRRLFIGVGGQRLCADRFDPVVRRDELLPVGTTRQITRLPVSSQETELELVLLSSENGVPRYADDPGVRVLGQVQVALPDRAGKTGPDQAVLVTLTFGGTEVLVKAAEAVTGRELHHQMTFARIE